MFYPVIPCILRLAQLPSRICPAKWLMLWPDRLHDSFAHKHKFLGNSLRVDLPRHTAPRVCFGSYFSRTKTARSGLLVSLPEPVVSTIR